MNTFTTIIAFFAAFIAFAAANPANTGVALSNGLIGSDLIASAPLATGYASAGWGYDAPSGIWANPGYPCPEGLSWAGQSGWSNSIAFNGAGLNWGADLLAPSLIAQQAPTLVAQQAPTLIAQQAPTYIAQQAPTLIAQQAPTYVAQQAPTLIAQPALSNLGWGKGLPC